MAAPALVGTLFAASHKSDSQRLRMEVWRAGDSTLSDTKTFDISCCLLFVKTQAMATKRGQRKLELQARRLRQYNHSPVLERVKGTLAAAPPCYAALDPPCALGCIDRQAMGGRVPPAEAPDSGYVLWLFDQIRPPGGLIDAVNLFSY